MIDDANHRTVYLFRLPSFSHFPLSFFLHARKYKTLLLCSVRYPTQSSPGMPNFLPSGVFSHHIVRILFPRRVTCKKIHTMMYSPLDGISTRLNSAVASSSCVNYNAIKGTRSDGEIHDDDELESGQNLIC